MPYVSFANVRTYHEDLGDGPPMLANHGYSECTRYWTVPETGRRLAERVRLIPFDMRGHGRTVVQGAPCGFDVDTMAADIDAIADGLGLDRFHLLSHATGGMVAVRYATRRSDRLLSLIVTDAGAATWPWPDRPPPSAPPSPADPAPEHDGRPPGRPADRWHGFISAVRARPGPFLNRIDDHPDAARLWRETAEVLTQGDRRVLEAFAARFYTDPDHHVDSLRGITCPTLVLVGEGDTVFVEPSEILAREVPDAELVVLPRVGHMTAIEDPDGTVDAITAFLERTGHTAGP